MEDIEKLKYPIGKYRPPESIDSSVIDEWINQITVLPSDLRTITVELSKEELEKTYRPGGWTIRQIIHHIADSHTNSLIRFKWALTEDSPEIKAYHEDRWAELTDSSKAPIELSIDFIDALHKKWVYLLRSMNNEQWDRVFKHPETGKEISLKKNLGLYAWHGNHHLAHIKNALHR
jgi:hypothetical protein